MGRFMKMTALLFAEVFAKSGKEAWRFIPAYDGLFQASAEWPDEFAFVTGNDIARASCDCAGEVTSAKVMAHIAAITFEG